MGRITDRLVSRSAGSQQPSSCSNRAPSGAASGCNLVKLRGRALKNYRILRGVLPAIPPRRDRQLLHHGNRKCGRDARFFRAARFLLGDRVAYVVWRFDWTIMLPILKFGLIFAAPITLTVLTFAAGIRADR